MIFSFSLLLWPRLALNLKFSTCLISDYNSEVNKIHGFCFDQAHQIATIGIFNSKRNEKYTFLVLNCYFPQILINGVWNN